MTCGMIEPDAGQRDAGRQRRDRLADVLRARDGGMGYLAQEQSVFRKLSVENNLLAVMEMLGMDRTARRKLCEELAGAIRHQAHPPLEGHATFPAAKNGGWKLPGA